LGVGGGTEILFLELITASVYVIFEIISGIYWVGLDHFHAFK
jgi:hypothetical protein